MSLARGLGFAEAASGVQTESAGVKRTKGVGASGSGVSSREGARLERGIDPEESRDAEHKSEAAEVGRTRMGVSEA